MERWHPRSLPGGQLQVFQVAAEGLGSLLSQTAKPRTEGNQPYSAPRTCPLTSVYKENIRTPNARA